MFEGDMIEGELEIGQVASYISEVKPAAQILKEVWADFITEKERMNKLSF
jgi:enoyl-[acyl-carrier protein] reductase II